MKICSVILSGGQSSRMGTNKALLTIDDTPVIQRIADELKKCTDDVIIISNTPKDYKFLQLNIFEDRYKEQGPLAGIESALYHSDAGIFIMAACDMPFVNSDVYRSLLSYIKDYDVVVPVYENQLHPLSGIYKKSVLPAIQQQLDQQKRKVKSFFDHVSVKFVDNFDLSEEVLKKHFFNMNEPDQFEKAKLMHSKNALH